MLKETLKLLMPGIALFVILFVTAVIAESAPFLIVASLLFSFFEVIPVILGSVIVAYIAIQWRRNWLAGLSSSCAPILVLVLGVFPHPVTSPIGWSANAVKVIYYRNRLQASYMQAEKAGQSIPVGQINLDGIGSLTSGLAYDPSGEVALPINKRSGAWMKGAGQTELGLEDLEAHHIFGAYYQWFHP